MAACYERCRVCYDPVVLMQVDGQAGPPSLITMAFRENESWSFKDSL